MFCFKQSEKKCSRVGQRKNKEGVLIYFPCTFFLSTVQKAIPWGNRLCEVPEIIPALFSQMAWQQRLWWTSLILLSLLLKPQLNEIFHRVPEWGLCGISLGVESILLSKGEENTTPGISGLLSACFHE